VFKKLFGSEENKEILKGLVNAVIEPEIPMKELTLKNPYNMADYVQGKNSILDIKCKDEKGRWFDVEMQIAEQKHYGQRALYYWSKVYTEQIQAGGDYMDLNPTIGIHLMDFEFFEDKRYYRCYLLKDRDTNEKHSSLEYLFLHFIEMMKFKKEEDKLESKLDAWVYFFNQANEMQKKMPSFLKKYPALVEAMIKLERIHMEPDERRMYENQEKLRMDAREEKMTKEENARLMEEKLRLAQEQGEIKGRMEGEIKAIESVLEIKWAEPGLAWMEKIKEVKEIEKLNSILSLVKKAKTMAELEKGLAKLV
jgi:predicted transposase/invertase (TIGR01784 family)